MQVTAIAKPVHQTCSVLMIQILSLLRTCKNIKERWSLVSKMNPAAMLLLTKLFLTKHR